MARLLRERASPLALGALLRRRHRLQGQGLEGQPQLGAVGGLATQMGRRLTRLSSCRCVFVSLCLCVFGVSVFVCCLRWFLLYCLLVRQFQAWRITHGFPQQAKHEFLQRLTDLWRQHEANMPSQAITAAQLSAATRFWSQLLVHCQDHQPDHLMAYCPRLYLRLLRATFLDDQVYHSVPTTPALLQTTLPCLVPSWLRKAYSWGIVDSARLPRACIFPKAKKDFTTARPIISYCSTMCAKLFEAVAKALLSMLQAHVPEQVQSRANSQAWLDLHDSFQRMQGEPVCLVNDDLVGFFTSILQDRLLTATSWFLQRVARERGVAIEDLNVTVDVRETSPALSCVFPQFPEAGQQTQQHVTGQALSGRSIGNQMHPLFYLASRCNSGSSLG